MVRHDLADIELADRVFAPYYAEGMAQRLAATSNVYRDCKSDSEIVGQLAAGTEVDVYDISGGWAWVFTRFGPGYVHVDVLSAR